MEQLSTDRWVELFENCRESACHLELRDAYGVDSEKEQFARWRREPYERTTEDVESRRWWLDMLGSVTGRGVKVLRARVVSEPVTEYIKFEWAGTAINVGAGEEVRWLPRHKASDIAIPGNDFWLFDGRLVVFNHFTGDGAWLGNEVTEAAPVAELCRSAFEDIWARATPHSEYKPS